MSNYQYRGRGNRGGNGWQRRSNGYNNNRNNDDYDRSYSRRNGGGNRDRGGYDNRNSNYYDNHGQNRRGGGRRGGGRGGRGRGRGGRGGRGSRGGGRGGRGGRGGGYRGGYGHGGNGYRGNGGGYQQQNNKQVVRFHDVADESLDREVLLMNKDHPGAQQIRILKFANSQWEAVESLTRGDFYYHNRIEKKNTKKKPAELRDSTAIKTEYRPYRVEYASRPTEYPKNLPTIILKTNSFQVKGKILETAVNQYEVSFVPSIKSELVTLREKVVLGSNMKSRRKNFDLLKEKFGEFQFDNHALYSMGAAEKLKKVIFEKDTLSSDYEITFHCIGDFRLSDPTIPIQQQEALLNIFNRKRLQNSGFSRIGRGWFKKGCNNNHGQQQQNNDNRRGRNNNYHNKMQEISVISSSSSCPDVNIIHGFECSMRILPKHGDRQLTVFKADLSHKLVERLTLHDKICLIKQTFEHQNNNGDDWKFKIEKECKRRHFLLSYNKRNLQISSIDWTQNESSLFSLGTGGKISYKDYLYRQYGIKSNKRELCVILDKSGAVFLPQHIRLTITSKQSDAIYDEVLNFVNPRTDERLNRIENFVQHINTKQQYNDKNGKAMDVVKIDMDFEIDDESLNTPAIVLTMPNIIIQGENGPMRAQPVDDFKYFQTRGFLQNVRQLRNWGIIYQAPRYEKLFQSFYTAYEQYIKKRHFDRYSGPICPPSSRPIYGNEIDELLEIISDSNNSDDVTLPSSVNNIINKNDQLLVLILPDGMRGSEMKAKFTKLIQSTKLCNKNIILQCIQQSTCRKLNACLGTFEDIMIKFGNIPYMIDPILPHKHQYINPDLCWVWGLDVSHVRDKPSVACLSISRRPFEGSLRSMHFFNHLNPSRKEIIAFVNMITLAYRGLEECYKATIDNQQQLPLSIFVFRDGVADGQIEELFTKEVVGIQRAITMFRNKYKIKAWKPKLQYILCNKNTIDRFGLLDQKTGLCRSLNKPCVIYDHVLSDRLWDFIIFPYHYKKNADRTKGVRYIVLFDDLKLHKKCGAALDLFQFIFSLTYMFAFSIPFPLGGTAQPAPIVYAKHYAESFSQSILSNDKYIRDLKINKNLSNRPHIITQTIFQKYQQQNNQQMNDENNNIVDGMKNMKL